MSVKNGARVTTIKYDTPQGRIIVERAERRAQKLKFRQGRSLLELSVVVEFLNQKYDENGIAVWNRETSHLGFLYPPFLRMYYNKGITVDQLREFTARQNKSRRK